MNFNEMFSPSACYLAQHPRYVLVYSQIVVRVEWVVDGVLLERALCPLGHVTSRHRTGLAL